MKYEITPERKLEILKKVKEGTEEQLVTMEVNIELANKRLEKARDEEEKWSIEKKIEHQKEEIKDLEDGLIVVEEKIKDESKGKKS